MINKMISFGAAAKRSGELAEGKKEAINKAFIARERAIMRAKDRVDMKFDQKKKFEEFKKSLGHNEAPEELKRIAFESTLRK